MMGVNQEYVMDLGEPLTDTLHTYDARNMNTVLQSSDCRGRIDQTRTQRI
ncbi:hypothetical protein F9C07_11387 [Aspergillus flavus]|uniref:Uncharacterized protein n=1 Tax=Aspergillus flavus (strain ATCC 200026 / FGSC A1120 / IAM 13836 / NRRL 3357 / JCM 12722 / SRRC 167) TaxID=332952 RepID=A0A7U2MSX7_ASPFN|nr:hypothetical protein F9C07_11387 [Aspergillus flavus]